MFGKSRSRLERKSRATVLAVLAGLAMVLVLALGFGSTAGAAAKYPVTTQSTASSTTPTVGGIKISRGPSTLPVTGGDIAGMAFVGVALIVTGAAVMRVRKAAADRASV